MTTETTQTTENAGAQAAEAAPKKDDFVLGSEERVKAETDAAAKAKADAPAEETAKKDPEPKKDEVETDKETDPDEGEMPKKRRGGWQRKIERLEAENAALKAAGGSKPTDPQKSEHDATAAKPKPKLDDFKHYDDFVEALMDWKDERARDEFKKSLEEREQNVSAEAKKKEFAAKAEKFNQQKDESRKLHEDFDEVLSEFDDVPVHPDIGAALLGSEMGAEVAYYLAKNSEEFDKLNQPHVSKVTIQRAIDAIEDKLSSQGKKSDPVKTSKAPPPVAPVGKGKGSSSIDPETADYETYKAWRISQKKRQS